MKTIIYENQRGLLFKQGKFVKMLSAGTYRTYGKSREIKVVSIEDPFETEGFDLKIFAQDAQLMKELALIEVPDGSIAFHYADGRYQGCLRSGVHAFWNVYKEHHFQKIDIRETEVGEEVPKEILKDLEGRFCFSLRVGAYEKARLYFDNRFVRLLEPGIYYFWDNGVNVDWDLVDTRLIQREVNGQEILTADKVAIRLNFTYSYRVSDCLKIGSEIEDYENQIYVLLQMILREYVGRFRLDEILGAKEQIGDFVLEKLREKEGAYFVEFREAGVKDIILPGEIREIMNTVLIAEKRAQANLIARREEVASTRSLLNTARLMEENKTLYKLKELEYIERISENIHQLNLGGGGSLLSELSRILPKAE